MKLYILSKLILGIISINWMSFPQQFQVEKMDTTIKCLQVTGIAVDEHEEVLDGVEITLFKRNEEMEWGQVSMVPYHDHNFTFTLDRDEYYTIQVSKPGYAKRLIVFSTSMPEGVSKETLNYEFVVSLFKEKKFKDDFYLDFPIALISYNKKRNNFENNDKYTHFIKSNLLEVTSNMKEINKKN